MIGQLETGWLLEKVIDRIRRFVVMTDDQALAVGLWVLHTWVLGATDTTPYLDVSSPVKQCGKTRLFEVLELLVRRPQFGANHTEATLFRSIEADRPTLLLDEIDRTFGKDAKLYAGIVGVLNAGYRRGATIPRMVGEGKNMTVKNFAVFGPKAFAGIGQLPDTVADRSIPIRLNRKSKADRTHRFRYAAEKASAADIVEALVEWSGIVESALEGAMPDLPDELSDRQWDIWEPLVAIADLAAPQWGIEARRAAVALHATSYTDDSAGILALDHIRQAFDGQAEISTDDLLHALVERDDGPWAAWWGNDVDASRTKGPATRLARLLKPFDIKPKQLWIEGGKVRGYTVEMFEKVWEIYLPPRTPPTDGRTVDGRPDMGSDQATTVLPSFGGGRGSTVFGDDRDGRDGCPECYSLWVFGHAEGCSRSLVSGDSGPVPAGGVR
jgi:Protein of unknown function (DUF3631)